MKYTTTDLWGFGPELIKEKDLGTLVRYNANTFAVTYNCFNKYFNKCESFIYGVLLAYPKGVRIPKKGAKAVNKGIHYNSLQDYFKRYYSLPYSEEEIRTALNRMYKDGFITIIKVGKSEYVRNIYTREELENERRMVCLFKELS